VIEGKQKSGVRSALSAEGQVAPVGPAAAFRA
jgi:hypothetical protein